MRIARVIANDYQRKHAITLKDRHDDFVSSLIEVGLRAALRYDPAQANGDQGISFVWKIMENRCDDFYRRKSEGFGDKRHGNDKRVVLVGTDDDFDTDIDFENLLSERRFNRWHHAADTIGIPFAEWIVQTLDQAAAHQLLAASG